MGKYKSASDSLRPGQLDKLCNKLTVKPPEVGESGSLGAYVQENERVYLDGNLVVTVWGNSKIDDTRLPGESWLDMRKRTEPLREKAKAKTIEMAKVIANALNLAHI